jgi:CRISPR-associated protein Cas2
MPLYVISYDIYDDKRRRTLVKILEGIGDRVQYSVFEAHLTETQLSRTRVQVRNAINPQMDSVRFYALGTNHTARIGIEGCGMVKQPLEYTQI